MPAFVALLRGVNVGSGNRVPMASLRAILSDLGYGNVVTLLNSGNAVFSAEAGTASSHGTRIATALGDALDVHVPVIVKSAREMTAIVTGNPFAVGDGLRSKFLVAFTRQQKDLATLAAIEPLVTRQEAWAIGAEAAYLSCPQGISKSKAALALLGKTGRLTTTRNWATALKLQALLQR